LRTDYIELYKSHWFCGFVQTNRILLKNEQLIKTLELINYIIEYTKINIPVSRDCDLKLYKNCDKYKLCDRFSIDSTNFLPCYIDDDVNNKLKFE
jgi:hypothetical protein